MFEQVAPTEPDPIFGLKEAFGRDPNPLRLDLVEGVYRDESGNTPILAVVKEAERRLLAEQQSKSYVGIVGDTGFGSSVRRLLLGQNHPLERDGRMVYTQSPGGTGALRIAGALVAQFKPQARVWLSRPTWENHRQVFAAAHLGICEYSYFDAQTSTLDFDRMLADLAEVRRDDVVVLHGCCHNPTGVDLDAKQWQQVGDLLEQRGALALVDIAYQGFGAGLEEDATGVREIVKRCGELLICYSFSKNLGVYRERVGALLAVARDRTSSAAVMTHIKTTIRGLYSNPPDHGAAIARIILDDPLLDARWRQELSVMRTRIATMRRRFADGLRARGATRDFAFMTRQNGLFSYAGLTSKQVDRLRNKHSIYVVATGRVNVAGLNEGNVDRVCDAIVDVLS